MRPPRRPLRPGALLPVLALLAALSASGCGLAGARPGGLARDAAAPEVLPPLELLLRLAERRLYVVDGDPATPDESFPIAVGRTGHETPVGRFQIFEKIEHPDYHRMDPKDRTRVLKRIPPGPENPLGERWIGFAQGPGWTVGIHGTPKPELLGRAVSGGCIRMRNADVIRVYERVQIGTPVVVER